jgi:hypothetical protein
MSGGDTVAVTQADKQCADLMYIAKDDMYRRREIAARHRIASQADALAVMREAEGALARAIETVMNVSVPSMGGDNLAVTICSHFDNPDQESDDDCGWTPDAMAAYEELKAAIEAHFAPTLANLRAYLAQQGEPK